MGLSVHFYTVNADDRDLGRILYRGTLKIYEIFNSFREHICNIQNRIYVFYISFWDRPKNWKTSLQSQTVSTKGLRCPFWGETVCPLNVLQPQKVCPRPFAQSRMIGPPEKYGKTIGLAAVCMCMYSSLYHIFRGSI